ncbi:hypothetical protein E1281_05240 [Actinomadura sp. KC345]|uniref:hypothetical protein n=1 Tax=Actinomadura sp. KC345 TaxID=2530371 RepID=UPI00104FD940|nr:hypothetical protein [Actinomadura sp. KC345]TDC57373.1 hypothetical protein E1281_05240 [Actinomadura sp. KC345]
MSYVAPWAGVTALAVALSWLGVRGVVRGTVAERSAPPPISGPVIHSSPPTDIGSPTSRPGPPADEDEAPGPSRSPKAPPGDPEREGRTSAASSGAKPDDNVRSYATRGGRAVLSIEKDRVRLVSATPEPGYETRVTQAGGWLRVDFLGDERTSSVVATWPDGDPAVKVYEY